MAAPHTPDSLCAGLQRLGVASGDIVMLHAAMSRMGRLMHGPDAHRVQESAELITRHPFAAG